jgi:hypothetical protein
MRNTDSGNVGGGNAALRNIASRLRRQGRLESLRQRNLASFLTQAISISEIAPLVFCLAFLSAHCLTSQQFMQSRIVSMHVRRQRRSLQRLKHAIRNQHFTLSL